MASDDNVVRLKHIKSLAQTVTDEIANITLQGGGSTVVPHDADFALYVPDSTSIIVTGKQQPILSLSNWSVADSIFSANITYNGDGTISSDIGTISNGILSVEDIDGSFNGVISVSSGNHFATSKLVFNFNTDTITTVAEPVTVTVEAEPKTAPSFSLGNWSNSDTVYSAVISYSGDGNLSANIGSISNGTLTVNDADGNFKGVVTASEGTVYAPGLLAFDYTTTTIAGASSTVTVEAEPVTVTVPGEPITVTVAGGGKTSPILTVGSFSGLQAPVTYNGDGNLNVLGGSLSGTILTACDYKGVIYSDATANFAPAVSKWQTPIEDYLVAYLPFDSSPTQDLCGSTWTAYGSPQIVDGKLSTNLSAYSYIDRQGTFSIGGQDFTIRFNFNMQPDSHILHILTQFYTKAATNSGNFCIQRSDDGDNRLMVIFCSNTHIIRFPCTMGVEHHIEVDYSHALATFFIYLDGVFINKFTAALSKTTFIGFNILGSSYGESSHGRYNGTVDEFQLFDGIALHTGTKSFAPPTAAEYAALKAKFLS